MGVYSMGKLLSTPKRKTFAIVSVIIVVSISLFMGLYFYSLYGSKATDLSVEVSLSSSEIVQGQNVTVTVEVINNGNLEMGTSMNVHNYPFFYSENFSQNNLSYIGPICQSLPFRLGEAQGSYGMTNLSNATPVMAYPGQVTLCWAMYNHMFQPSIQFKPHSYNVSVSYPFGGSARSVMKGSITTSGFWAINGGNYTFHTFQPGTYTFVGEDGWGQASIQYLTVKSA